MTRLFFGLIFLVLSASTILWTLANRTPPAWDQSDHFLYEYDYYRLLAHADFAGFVSEFFSTRHYYAPLVHLVSAVIFLVLGASKLIGIAVNLLSLGIVFASVAWISRKLYAKSVTEAEEDSGTPVKTTTLVSVVPALIASCYHFSAWLLHDAFLDFPLIAATAAGFALLVRADDFRVRRHAIAFAISAGLGMLVKQTFAFFFVLPAIYVAGRVLLSRDRRAIANLALATVIFILIASVWYFPHWQDVVAIYRENQQAAVNENEAPLFTFDSNFFYVHAMLSMQMQLPLATLFVLGLVYSLVRSFKKSLVLYLWVLSGIVCFTLVANKDVRYTVPVLPAAAILSTSWFADFFAKSESTAKLREKMKAIAVSAIVIWSFVSFFNAQWPRDGSGIAIDTPRYRWMVFARNYYGFDHRPWRDEWAVPEVVQSLAARGSPTPVLGVVVNLPYLNPSSIALYSRLLNSERAGPPLLEVRWVVEPSMIGRIDECEYVLVRTGLDKADWVAPVERDVERLIREHPETFSRDTGFPIPLPDAEAVIYRHKRAKTD